ncbi:hypothetical protein TrVE_jg9296 [Triparma verrucosa]|uniref:Uncharacterized protein n=1 Tax=Triparma verrucosa TaxID=1606542 RepID=A0A9W7FA09_9STRA|nr:hypothetical protein TrVE_jg9296 [Triparma verrucosa]
MITSFFNPPIKVESSNNSNLFPIDTSRNLKSSGSGGSYGGSNSDNGCTVEFCEAPYHPYGWCEPGEVYTNRSNNEHEITCPYCSCSSSCCAAGTDHPCDNDNLDTGGCSVGYCEAECDGALAIIAMVGGAIVLLLIWLCAKKGCGCGNGESSASVAPGAPPTSAVVTGTAAPNQTAMVGMIKAAAVGDRQGLANAQQNLQNQMMQQQYQQQMAQMAQMTPEQRQQIYMQQQQQMAQMPPQQQQQIMMQQQQMQMMMMQQQQQQQQQPMMMQQQQQQPTNMMFQQQQQPSFAPTTVAAPTVETVTVQVPIYGGGGSVNVEYNGNLINVEVPADAPAGEMITLEVPDMYKKSKGTGLVF